MITKILFIGQGIFRDGLSRLIGEVPAVEIIGAVETCTEAEVILKENPPDVLIVDHAQIASQKEALENILEHGPESLKVIYLTLSENKMVVHNRQRLSDVTLPTLIDVLQNVPGGSAE